MPYNILTPHPGPGGSRSQSPARILVSQGRLRVLREEALGTRSWVLGTRGMSSQGRGGAWGSEMYLCKEGLRLGVLSLIPDALFLVLSRIVRPLPHRPRPRPWLLLLLGPTGTAATASTAWTPARRVSGGGTPSPSGEWSCSRRAGRETKAQKE